MNRFKQLFNLSRVTSSGKFYPEIDGLRFLAIFPVILTHFYYVYLEHVSATATEHVSFFKFLFLNGGSGIHIFFVISGYILCVQFHKKAPSYEKFKDLSIKKYFIRRLTRLEPPYILSLIGLSVLLLIAGQFTLIQLLPHFLASFFYIHNIIYGSGSVINTVAWTLEIEFQFYILAPFLIHFFRKKTSVSLLYFGLALLFFIVTTHLMGSSYRSLLSQGHYFLLGALLHVSIPFTKKVTQKLSKFHTFILLFSVIFCFFLFPTLTANLSVNFTKLILLFLLFSFVLGNPYGKQLFSNKIIYSIGGMCYSIYLVHYPLLSIINQLFPHHLPPLWIVNSTVYFAIVLSFSVLIVLFISTIFFIFIEKPFMHPELSNKIYKKLG